MIVQIREIRKGRWDWILWDDSEAPWYPHATSIKFCETPEDARAAWEYVYTRDLLKTPVEVLDQAALESRDAYLRTKPMLLDEEG